MTAENGTIGLVHGAWAGRSCWQNTILPLKRLGVDVLCAPLPLTSLTDDMAALCRTLPRTNGPVVLVGHAYEGAAIAGPTGDRIKALVYVSALAPGDAETIAQVFYREPPHSDAPIWSLTHKVSFGCPRTACATQSLTMPPPIRPLL
jgi:pimeloyl-ACP methyl ester carboxylesterase